MINIKWTGLEELQAVLDPKLLTKATTWALNRTAKNAITAGDKEVRARNAIKKKDITKGLKTIKATDSNQIVTIQISGTKISIASFSAKQTAKGVTFKVKKKEKRKLIPHAFKAARSAFLRDTSAAYPIRELTALSIAEMFEVQEVIDAMDKRIKEMFPKNLDSRYKFLIDREARRTARRASR